MSKKQETISNAHEVGHTLSKEVPVGYKRTEVGVIPEDWREMAIGLLANVIRGASPRPIDSPVWFDSQSRIGWLRISDVTASGKFLYDTTQNLSAAGIVNSRSVKSGNLVMSICATVGRPIITRKDVCIHDGFVVFDNLRADKEYLYYVLLNMEASWSKHGQTGSQMNLNTGLISSTSVPLPPLPEQRAIAEALSDVDGLLATLEKLIAKKRAIKQATMQQLLTGKTRLPGFSGEWETKRIDTLFESKAGGDLDSVRSSDVQNESYPYPIYANSLSQEGLYGFCNYAKNRPGSITVTARGTLGKAFYRDTPFVAIGRLLVLEPKVRMDARFFSNYINHSIHFAVESTGVPQLTAPQVERYSLPVPPNSEQHAISEILSDMDAEIAALERRIDKTRTVKQGMMQQLLTGRVRLLIPVCIRKNKTC